MCTREIKPRCLLGSTNLLTLNMSGGVWLPKLCTLDTCPRAWCFIMIIPVELTVRGSVKI
ncbi:hypothetical protein Bca101_049702 [Brassica carinata]